MIALDVEIEVSTGFQDIIPYSKMEHLFIMIFKFQKKATGRKFDLFTDERNLIFYDFFFILACRRSNCLKRLFHG
jgi:hypothetical protein